MRRNQKVATLIALTTTACTTWRVQPGPTHSAVQARATKGDEPIRLNMNSGATVVIYEASVVGDSVIGMNGPSTMTTRSRVAVATADVESVATNEVSVGRTIGALALITLAVLIIIGVSTAGSSSSSSNSSCASTASLFVPSPVAA